MEQTEQHRRAVASLELEQGLVLLESWNRTALAARTSRWQEHKKKRRKSVSRSRSSRSKQSEFQFSQFIAGFAFVLVLDIRDTFRPSRGNNHARPRRSRAILRSAGYVLLCKNCLNLGNKDVRLLSDVSTVFPGRKASSGSQKDKPCCSELVCRAFADCG